MRAYWFRQGPELHNCSSLCPAVNPGITTNGPHALHFQRVSERTVSRKNARSRAAGVVPAPATTHRAKRERQGRTPKGFASSTPDGKVAIVSRPLRRNLMLERTMPAKPQSRNTLQTLDRGLSIMGSRRHATIPWGDKTGRMTSCRGPPCLSPPLETLTLVGADYFSKGSINGHQL